MSFGNSSKPAACMRADAIVHACRPSRPAAARSSACRACRIARDRIPAAIFGAEIFGEVGQVDQLFGELERVVERADDDVGPGADIGGDRRFRPDVLPALGVDPHLDAGLLGELLGVGDESCRYSAWMNCFQRSTRIDAPGSGGGPFQVGAARATPPGSRRPRRAPDCRTCRLETSTTFSSLAHAATHGAKRRLSFDITLVRSIAPMRRSARTRSFGRPTAELSHRHSRPFTSIGRQAAPRRTGKRGFRRALNSADGPRHQSRQHRLLFRGQIQERRANRPGRTARRRARPALTMLTA